MPVWYYSRNGQSSGPVSEEHLRALFGSGQLGADVWVWHEGMPQWSPAWQAGLIPATVAAPPNPWQQALTACRAMIGGPPRQLSVPPANPPPWMHKFPKDALWEVYRQQEWLFRQGGAVWGHVVQANQQLFSKGLVDCPASVIYSTDPWFDAGADALGAIAHSLYAVKGKGHPDPEMAEFSRLLADEKDRAPRLAVPRALTGGRAVFHTSVMVVRDHLPQGYLTHSLFPLLIEPRRTTAAMIVPWWFWPPDFVGMWNARVS